MKHDDPARARGPHPFFHTMVMMGSALALGCGGLSGGKNGDDDAGGGTGGTTGGTGGTGGTQSTTGGTATAGTGGSGGSTVIVGTGGTGNVPVAPGPFPCAPETWACNDPPHCAGRDYVLPSDCTCDSTRPASAAACATDQSFVCRQAQSDDSGHPFTEPVRFSCSCVPSGQSCETTCEQVFGGQGGPGTCRSDTTDMGTESVLCGCAQIVLR